jgi:hypothetical protein
MCGHSFSVAAKQLGGMFGSISPIKCLFKFLFQPPIFYLILLNLKIVLTANIFESEKNIVQHFILTFRKSLHLLEG